MVFDKADTIEIEVLKQKHKIDFETLRHQNKMAELKEEYNIAVMAFNAK